VFQGSLLVIVLWLTAAENAIFFAKAASDLKSSHVCEKLSKISLSEFLQQYITAKLHVRTPNNVIFVHFVLVNLWILAVYAAKKVSLRARSIDRPEYEYPEILL